MLCAVQREHDRSKRWLDGLSHKQSPDRRYVSRHHTRHSERRWELSGITEGYYVEGGRGGFRDGGWSEVRFTLPETNRAGHSEWSVPTLGASVSDGHDVKTRPCCSLV